MKVSIATVIPLRSVATSEFPSFNGWVAKHLSALLLWGGCSLGFALFAAFVTPTDLVSLGTGQIVVLGAIYAIALGFLVSWAHALLKARHDHRVNFVPGHRAWLKRQIDERATLLRNRYRCTLDVVRADDKALRLMLSDQAPETPARRLIADVLRFRIKLDRLGRAA